MPRILVIDDSPTVLEMAEIILAGAGHRIVTCTNGKSAVQILRHESFDLIVTDIYMPDEDGLEVIREQRKICPDVPVVAMSGVTGPRNMLAVARHLGAAQTLRKPFSQADLLTAVRAALGAAPARHPAAGPGNGEGRCAPESKGRSHPSGSCKAASRPNTGKPQRHPNDSASKDQGPDRR